MTRVLLPGYLIRHIADTHPAPLYGPEIVEMRVLCTGEQTLAPWSPMFDRVSEASLKKNLVCPACLATLQPADDVDETMGTIPLFDLP